MPFYLPTHMIMMTFFSLLQSVFFVSFFYFFFPARVCVCVSVCGCFGVCFLSSLLLFLRFFSLLAPGSPPKQSLCAGGVSTSRSPAGCWQ